MNNIVIKKSWEDDKLLEIKVRAKSEFVNAYQFCYIQKKDLQMIGDTVVNYVKQNDKDCYVGFGNKKGDHTPAFSLKFLQANGNGHVKIEVDIEIDDNDTRCHRCSYYVESELGLIEQFGEKLIQLSKDNYTKEIELNKTP